MKVSINWIREYIGFDLPSADELATRIGSQLGEVDSIINIGAKYQGAVIVKVVECSRLANSDHLNLCFIDDGGVVQDVTRRSDGLVQVVCGAPNVTAGRTVVWLPPGATVPSTYDTDPFVLEARELRGAVSNGMLASPKELAIGDSHEGILILDDELQAGASFAAALKLDDTIIDIENKMFTHRPDCFGQLGVAREVAGIFGQQFLSPDWYVSPRTPAAGEGLPLSVVNEVPNEVTRFMMVPLKNVVIGDSPVWLQTQLSRMGIRPINNVVDITNYVMLLTGQPLHAYDYDKVAALSGTPEASIVVRYPRPDEQLQLLNGKTITPRSEAILIATDQQPIGLGGAMGGANTEVDSTTQNIILECGTFDMYSIRRTSMAHGIFTDAVTRYNKGQSPFQNSVAVAHAVELFEELAHAVVAGPVVDENNIVKEPSTVEVGVDFINARLGIQLSGNEMKTLLQNVEFEVTNDETSLQVKAPFWRTDIDIAEDVVEEIGRLYGFDKLAQDLPVREITPAPRDPLLLQKTLIRNSLVKAGANELLTYSFVHGNLLDKVGQDRNQAFAIGNALSPDLQYYRFSPLASLLDKVHANVKSGYDAFALFELGKGHSLEHADNGEGVPFEFEDLDFVYASKNVQPGAAFYRARRYLDTLAQDMGVTLTYRPFAEDPHDPITDPFDLSRSAQVLVAGTDQILGVVGEFKISVQKGLKLPPYVAGFSISQKQLLRARQTQSSSYVPLPKYPKIEQDICLKVPSEVAYVDLEELVATTLDEHKPEHTRLTTSLLDIYQREDDAAHKQITFRVGLASYQKTMTGPEMTALLEAVTAKAQSIYAAERM